MGGDAALSDARKDLVRLLGLAQALALQACHRVKDIEWLIDKQLVDRDSAEHKALTCIPGPGYNEVYGWFIERASKYGAQGMIDERMNVALRHPFLLRLLQARLLHAH